MKILHIINNLQPAGAEILLSDVAVAMKEKGVNNEVVTLFRYSEKCLYRKLLDSGVVVHSLDLPFRYDIRILFALKKLIHKGRYDVVHANLFPAFYWAALAQSRFGEMILTEHNTSNRRTGNLLLSPFEKAVCCKYDRIVCISNNVKDVFAGRFPSLANRISVIYNGININRFANAQPASRRDLGIPEDVPVCIMVSRFYKPKDHKTIIDAAAHIPNLHVLFAGEGELEHPMRVYAQDIGMASRIHFLGYRVDVPSLFKASDVCVQSSYNEGFSLSVAEAMACGIPVIASDVHALNEVVQDNASGLLFRCADSKDLANKIELVLNDPNLYARLRAGGQKRAQDFSLDNTVNSLLRCTILEFPHGFSSLFLGVPYRRYRDHYYLHNCLQTYGQRSSNFLPWPFV